MNIFDEALAILKSKVKTRQLLESLHAEDIERIIKRLESVYEEKQLVALAAEEELTRKKEAMQSVLEQMKELGLSASDLSVLETGKKTRRQYAPRQKYVFSYQAPDGEERTWEGAVTGRTPADFADYLKQTGKSRKDCIVAES